MSGMVNYTHREDRKMPIKRPEVVEDDHLKYLDSLRNTGKVNMFGAGPYIQEAFDMDAATAATVVVYWMQSFKERCQH